MNYSKYILRLILSLPIMVACSLQPHISSTCEKDKGSNYILKWEIFPETDNSKVQIYISDNDTIFPKNPLITVNATDYITSIPERKGIAREFFKLKINNSYSEIITNRVFPMDSVQNLRDLGGYITSSNQQTRWGQIYRSGSLSRLSERDTETLSELNIKTIIDFRSKDQTQSKPDRFHSSNYISLPLNTSNFTALKGKIKDGNLLRGDAIIFTQDLYRNVIENETEKLAAFFNILADQENFPILFHCILGKDISGIVSYLVLRTIDIPQETIDDDYMLSNLYINKNIAAGNVSHLTEPMQEAMTMISSVDIAYLKYGISCMKKKSGSVENYIKNELKITAEKKARIKKNLLYPDSFQ